MPRYLNELLDAEIERLTQAFAAVDPIHPGFSLSIKTTWRNSFGQEEPVMLLGQADRVNPRLPAPEGWSIVRLEALRGLIELTDLSPADLPELLSNTRAVFSSPMPPAAALLHAALPTRFVCFSQLPVLLAGFCLPQPLTRLAGWFQQTAIVLPFEPNLHRLAQAISQHPALSRAFVLLNRGVIAGADSPADCRQAVDTIDQIASQNLPPPQDFTPGEQGDFAWDGLPKLRAELCAQRGRPLLIQLDDSPVMRDFIETRACAQLVQCGAPTPELSVWTGGVVMLERNGETLPKLPEESRSGATILLKPGVGAMVAAGSTREAQQAATALWSSARAAASSVFTGEHQPAEQTALKAAVAWETYTPPARLPFDGEVAVVTGSASGIGKAIVASLLERGSAVAGLDINPSITTTFDHPAYLGLCCDVADEASVCQAIRAVTRRFGGLDILALNAGLFPGGCNIENMSLAEFTRVINVNFIANLVILREAFPLLKLAPRYGRVVIIGSKNMRAPGPGAAAYSTSKAALTQLARVAALEWGCERVRVNVIHPDSVFDTALYTEDVLRARAAHYGMTVDQYKKRNLLKTEITSHDVAELAAEMCGPLFRHMSGGQIQLDGGNDRTI